MMIRKMIEKLKKDQREERKRKGLFQQIIEMGLWTLGFVLLGRVLISAIVAHCTPANFSSAFNLTRSFLWIVFFLFLWVGDIIFKIWIGKDRKKGGLKNAE